MSNYRSLDYGWFFLRLASGLLFLQKGAEQFSSGDVKLLPMAALICGVALILGLLVRPAVLVMLTLLVIGFVRGAQIDLSLIRRSLVELLALVGFLVGGGGSFINLGSLIRGLNGKWYQ